MYKTGNTTQAVEIELKILVIALGIAHCKHQMCLWRVGSCARRGLNTVHILLYIDLVSTRQSGTCLPLKLLVFLYKASKKYIEIVKE